MQNQLAFERSLTSVEQYWEGKNIKIWVVCLSKSRAKNAKIDDVKYVRARDKSGAIRTAFDNCYTKGVKYVHSVRFASPYELGCTEG